MIYLYSESEPSSPELNIDTEIKEDLIVSVPQDLPLVKYKLCIYQMRRDINSLKIIVKQLKNTK
jgi:hypothetical protein